LPLDIDIVGMSQSAVQDAYLALEREAAKVRLKINEQNTKYMIAARNDRTIPSKKNDDKISLNTAVII
jgi:hypothetical protein